MRRAIALGLSSLALILWFGTVPAMARALPDGGVTRQEIIDWLRGHGYTGSITTFGDSVYVAVSFPGAKLAGIYFYGCVKNRCRDIQYWAGFTGGPDITLDKVNSWNRGYRFIRSYLQESGNVFGEYDVEVSPGGSWEQLDASLAQWEGILATFKTYMNR